MAKLGLSTPRFSFEGERDSAAQKISACCFLGHTSVEIPGHVPEGTSQRVLRDNTPSDLIGHQDEIAERTIQMIKQSLDLHLDLFFLVLEVMIEIPEPYREAVDDAHFSAARQNAEHTGKFNGLLDRVKLIAPFFAVPRGSLFHFLIKGNGRGDENPL
jgi:hypothetical protein